jgi:hypothetical protein
MIEIMSICQPLFDNRLSNHVAAAINAGWTILAPPIFIGSHAPCGMNEYAVGTKHPHFMLLMQRDVKTTAAQAKKRAA